MAGPEDLIPHRPPWRLIDRVVESTAGRVRAEKRLSSGDPLTRGGELSETLVIEALAQTAACVRSAERGAHLGYLVAAGEFEFHRRARVGDTLVLEAELEAELGALSRFSGRASIDGELVAAGRMTFSIGALT